MSMDNDKTKQYINEFESLIPELQDAWAGYRDEVFKG